MRFSELLQSIGEPVRVTGTTEMEIRGLFYDSRAVIPGGLFFALRGAAVDGHSFLSRAVNAGAVALVVEDDSEIPEGIAAVTVRDARLAMARMAACFYGNPTAGVPLIGITGTNGKTTTTYLIESILEKGGIPAAVLGTINYRFGATCFESSHTTPESVDLQKILKQLVDLGAQGVVMEVSSHALEQKRVDGCLFDVGVFTNLTRDHLDYHHDMASYLGSKQRLFSELLVPDRQKPLRHAVVNIDDPAGAAIARSAACPVLTYGLNPGAAVSARDVVFSTAGISGTLSTPVGETAFLSRLLGRFNLYNILSAVGAACALGISLDIIRSGIEEHGRVEGRLERVENDRGFTVLVDYAHTGDALENVLQTLQELATARIITVFGCGGDRDRGKRPIMGEVAGRFSDLAIITSDNPRSEEPSAIIREVREGLLPLKLREYRLLELTGEIAEKGFLAVESRRDAIRLAVRLARPGDIVLIAGKGHEDYQIIGSEKHHFDDREEAAIALRSVGGVA
ncbi:MAG: UDP-N-acetylmuramoyl-L-alanyl-D-glutamate--2,6-diaminopimelate ligase [Deltaproteobacteria bacterium]|nr:UDP-N-acetylmuramoyl-L-alanyl-D-glutamate--2,6-diaminopimelate ligase [Deltaproteobacteria bacterium]